MSVPQSPPDFTHDGPGVDAATWADRPEWAQVADLDLSDLDGEPVRRLVVVAAHPDDESLGAAGLLARAHARGLEVLVVLATLGEASHPGSPTLTPAALSGRRLRESHAALAEVAPGGRISALDLGDGRLATSEAELCRHLVEIVGDGRGTLLVAPWRHDGHPDHEAAGRAAAVAAVRTGARLLEYPVWLWHWGAPPDLPWRDVRRLPLSTAERAAKAASVQAHRTQVAGLSDQPGDEVLLGAGLLAHFAGGHETYLEQPTHDPALEQVHQQAEDPWGVDTRWFEERKRRLVLACLPARRYAAAWEAGCSTGGLAQALLSRCEVVVGTDSSTTAVAAARERLADEPRARVEERDVTAGWPAASYDLVVLSEVGYFLSPRDLDRFGDVVEVALRAGGVLVLCHWRHDIEGWPRDGADVSARLAARVGWSVQARYADRDVEILVLARSDVLPASNA